MRSKQVFPLLFLLMLCGGLRTKSENAISTLGLRGVYVGLEPMKNQTPEEPAAQWYYENTLLIRDGEVVLDKAPIVINNGRKEYSASDGGFLSYRGRIIRKQSGLIILVRLYASDYIIFPVGPAYCEPYSRIDVFPLVIGKGQILFDGVRYVPKPIPKDRENWRLKVLAEESLEHTRRPYRSDMNQPPCPLPAELTRP